MNNISKRKPLASVVRSIILAGAMSTIAIPSVFAEENDEDVNTITITGSAIKRTDVEGALPITVITAEDIEASGVSDVPELISQIPSMQGMDVAADTVGGGGGGIQSASLRDLGSEYTLVLLNGRRLPSADSGSTIDLSTIPLAAIERVEVLTDGASALYGSDAIAGVVNFILKQDVTESTVSVRYDQPQETGGESLKVSFSTGFGDIERDGYNILFSFNHDEHEQLASKDRDFASTGIIGFTDVNGNDLVWQETSVNAIPANAYVRIDADGDGVYDSSGVDYETSFNPWAESNGGCGAKTIENGTVCAYDFTETLEIFPERESDNVFLNGIFDISDDLRFTTNLAWSRYTMISRIAPYPTDTIVLPSDTGIVVDNVYPHLTAEEIANINRVAFRWRVRPGGNRTDEWKTETFNLTAGLEGEAGDIVWNTFVTYSDSSRDNTRLTGYPIQDELMGLLTTGAVDIFQAADEMSDEANAAIKSAMSNGPWTTTDTSLKAIEASMSMPVFDMDGGSSYFAAGFDYRESEYVRSVSEAVTDEIILFEAAEDTPAFDLSRSTYGIFAEMLFPITDMLEITGAVRYDSIGAITDATTTGTRTVGNRVNDTTYKVTLSYRPDDDWLVRASIGTGFKAATMRQIAEPRIPFGVTSSSYDCPFSASDPLAQYCLPDRIQYVEFREGNGNLKPETSEQASVGFVYAPSQEFSFNIDWWQVNLEDQVRRPTESAIFGDPELYRDLYTSKLNTGTGEEELAIILAPVNIGESNNEGIDWGMTVVNDFSFGSLKTTFNGTYMILSESSVVGAPGEFETSLGLFGPNEAVTFRNIVHITNTLVMGDFAHRLNVNYRSGYEDKFWEGGSSRIRLADDFGTASPYGTQLSVPSYTTFDYQTKWALNDKTNVTFGIKNLTDAAPPFSLRASGAGHQVGYDPRYSDPFGRTFYLSADYTF